MFRKIVKYIARTVAILLGLVLLLVGAIYLPPVQDFIKKKAVAYVSERYALRVSVDRLRLKFPLRLSIDNAEAVTAQGDTLFRCGSLRADVALWPLLRGKAEVRQFAFRDASFHLDDTTGGVDLRIRVREFDLGTANAEFGTQTARVPAIRLIGGDVRLNLSVPKPDTTTRDTASAPLLWKIGADQLTLEDIAFTMHTAADTSNLSARIGTGVIGNCAVDLSDMTVTAERLRLGKGMFAMQRPSAEALAEGIFDPNRIDISELQLSIDSVWNRKAEVRARFNELTFVERSGLTVTRLQGRVAMDSVGYAAQGLDLQTTASSLRADLFCGVGITAMDPATPVTVDFLAALGSADLARFVRLPRQFNGKELKIDTRMTGTLGDLDLQTLTASLFGTAEFQAQGRLRSITEPDRLEGQLKLNGALRNPGIAAALLPSGVRLPAFRFRGEVQALPGTYSARMDLYAEGHVGLNGSFSPATQRYRAEIQIDSLPLRRFLPSDSLGRVTLTAKAEGRGFDFFSARTTARAEVQVAQAEFNDHDYQNVNLTAELADNRFGGTIVSDNNALDAALQFGGTLTRERQEATLTGDIRTLDLRQMRFAADTLAASLRLYAEASATPAGTYAASVTLDSLNIGYGTFHSDVPRTTLTAEADTSHTAAQLASGDLHFDFLSSMGLDSLTAGFAAAAEAIQAQIWAGRVNTDTLERLLPPFQLEFRAAKNNILNAYLRSQGMGFGRAEVTAAAAQSAPFGFRAEVDQFTTEGIVLDTITAGVGGRNGELQYYVRLANRPGNLNRMGLIGLFGRAAGNTGEITLRQRDRNGRTGLNFGLRATLGDSAVVLNLIPEHPTFGFAQWTVGGGNYIQINADRTLAADLNVTRAGQSFGLHSVTAADMPPGSVRLSLSGLNIANALSILPTAPPLAGRLGGDLTFGMGQRLIAARGEIHVDTLQYDNRCVGDIGVGLSYRNDSLATQEGTLDLMIDRRKALAVTGRYAPSDSTLQFMADIPGIPLAVANPFLPEGSGNLTGLLKGHFEAAGHTDSLRAGGSLRFDSTSVTIAAIGTRFGISDNPIVFEGGKMLFRDFAVVAPNKRRLTVDGAVDLHRFSGITADLTVRATDFQLINVPRNRGSMVFGQASADLSARVRGPLDALDIRGDVSLLKGTEVTYVMQDSPAGIQEKQQNVVTFKSFNDTTILYAVRPPALLKTTGVDMLLNVSIDPDVQMAVYLSEDGQNRINLRGGGNLTYSMNRLGDTRLAGKYELSGGQVRYNPPVISVKDFSISPGGYVSWTGELADPSFSIRAVETVRTTVTMEDQQNRQVKFEISINISGTLNNLTLRFDLAAPEDLTLQNQLSSLTAEQRQNQALSLLAYNTYSGPGTSATVNTGNPINSFIAKELNQWAQNSLKGVDLSFGVDSYNNAAAGPDGTRTDYSYKLSKKLFDNRVKIMVGGKVSSGNAPNQSAAENLIDDLSVEYQLTRRDNMYLKVFRQVNFESILEGDVTETGVGFGVRKKVLRLGDLFKVTKAKKEEKAARKATRAEQKAEKRRQKQQK